MAQRLIVEIVGDSQSLERALKRSDRSTQQFATRVTRNLVGVGAAFFSARGLIRGLESSVNAASDLNEQLSKNRAVFARSAPGVEKWARSMNELGLSTRAAVEAASGFGALFKPLGLVGDEAARQSVRLTKLGVDLASFYDTDVRSALDAVRSGLVGESEPLRRYGVLLSEAKVQAEAFAMTGKDTAASLTQTDKVLARQAIILRESAVAQGDAAKSAGRHAGQQKALQANLENTAASIGQALLPAVEDITEKINTWLGDTENQKKLQEGLTAAIEDTTAVIGFFAGALRDLKKAWDALPDFGKDKGLLDYIPVGDFLRGATSGGWSGPKGAGGFFSLGGGNFTVPGAGTVGAATAGTRPSVKAAIANANSTLAALTSFIGKWTAAGTKFENAQKAEAARRARAALQRQRFQAGLANQWDWLQFGLEKAQATKTLTDDRQVLRKQEAWLKNRIAHAGRTYQLVSDLWRVRQKIRDLNKQKTEAGDPLAGLMQVSSKRMAGLLGAGLGLSGAGMSRLQANISGQEITVYSILDGHVAARSVNRANAQTAHRTSRQTSGLRG